MSQGRSCNGPPLAAPRSPLKLTVPKQGRISFIWQQGWAEQSAGRGVRARAVFRKSVQRVGWSSDRPTRHDQGGRPNRRERVEPVNL